MVISHELEVDSQKLVALSFNPEAPGTPIILLHGICSSVYYWTDDLIAPFLKQGPCYALSLPGHFPAAFSPKFNKDELTAETITRLLCYAIRDLVGAKQVILVGFSTGGFAALSIAAHVPEMVKSVISISGFAHGRWIGLLGRSQALTRLGWPGNSIFKFGLKLSLRIRSMHRASLRFFTANHRRFLSYPYLERSINHYLPHAQHLDSEAMAKYFSIMPKIDISPYLSQITAPTLIISGDSDPIVPPSQSRLIADKISRSSLTILKGAGHFPFFERPGEFHRTVNRWLNLHVASPQINRVSTPIFLNRLEQSLVS